MAYQRRSIYDIMYSDQEVDILFIQPMQFKRVLYEDQNKVFLDFWETINRYSSLLNDLPFEPHHGLLQLAAILEKAGVSVDLLDFHMLDYLFREQHHRMVEESDIVEILQKKSAKVFGISCKTVSANRALRIAELIKQIHPESWVVLGGIHATFQAPEMMKCCEAVDIVVRGEADDIIVPLFRCLQYGGNLSKIPGIVYRDIDGHVTEVSCKKTKIDLDALPYPAYELFCREGSPMVPRILSARGCILKCVFCASSALFDYKINFREPKRVVDQIQHTQDKFGVDFICLGDLTFMANLQRGREICHEMIRRGLNIKWSCQTTVGRIDSDTANLMKRANCVQIGLGIEGGTQEQLDCSNKNVLLSEAEEQCKIMKDAGISVQTYWVLGLPNESYDSAMKTIELMSRFVHEELTDITHITVAQPYPGTPLYENPEAHGIRIVDHNFDNYWSNGASLGTGYPVTETPYLSNDHIYMFWQLALATVTEEFKRRFKEQKGKLHFVP